MIRKAVIPVAGFGTRMFPATLGLKKVFLPIIDKDLLPKPAVQIIIEEALKSGIEEVCLVIHPDDEESLVKYFNAKTDKKLERKLRENKRFAKELDWIKSIGERLHFAYQKRQEGFGHAVYQARRFVGEEPFLLLLGDQISISNTDKYCARQIIDVFNQHKNASAVIALTRIQEKLVHLYGCAGADLLRRQKKFPISPALFKIKFFIEKPDINTARKLLKSPILPEGFYFCVFGQYIFTPQIFDYLEYEIKNNLRFKGEFQLTTAMDKFCRETKNFLGFEMNGEYFDIGRPDSYAKAVSILMEKGKRN